jgi:hypothetical protein
METTTTHAHLLPIYRRLRQVGLKLNHTLVATLDKEVVNDGGRRLGILKNDTLVLDTEDELAVLMDFCIHDIRIDGRNAVERYIERSGPPVGSDEDAVLATMLTRRYSLMQVIDTEPDVGVTARDIWRDDMFFVADIGLGSTARPGSVFATRLFFVENHGFYLTGGAGLPVVGETLDEINKVLSREFGPGTDFARLDPDEQSELAALVIRTCLGSGMSSRIMYGASAENSARKERSIDPYEVRRANRNDPCPCGSGRKFKSCCGRRPRL